MLSYKFCYFFYLKQCITWFCHTVFHRLRVLLSPFHNLFFHFQDLGRIKGPQAALSCMGSHGFGTFDFSKALVKGEVVSYRVLKEMQSIAVINLLILHTCTYHKMICNTELHDLRKIICLRKSEVSVKRYFCLQCH